MNLITRYEDIPAARLNRLEATVLANNTPDRAPKRACLTALLLHARREARIALVARRARILFTTDKAVPEWLSSPAHSLAGRKPLDLFDTDDGAETVLQALEGIIHGNPM